MLVQTCTKAVLINQDKLSANELAFFRSVFNFLASSVYICLARQGLADNISRDNVGLLITRCISGTVCFLCFVIAMMYLPLSIFFVMMNATPFLIAVLACLWLKEVITLVEVLAMCGAFGGILLAGLSKREVETEEELAYAQDYRLGLLFAIGCVLGQSVTLVTTRKLKMLSVY